MRTSTSLRARVVIAATAFGLALSTLFAIVTHFVTEDYEMLITEAMLRSLADDYARRLAHEAEPPLPDVPGIRGYVRRADGSGTVPALLAGLGPGGHELDTPDGGEIEVAVYDAADRRLWFVIDLATVERREQFLTAVMLAILLTGTLVSQWLGWLMAGRIIGPVGRLARAVSERSPEDTSPLAADFARDELGRLAAAFDGYHARSLAHAERERAFASEASHGLRTPIAVIRGAVEVLLDDPQLQPALRERLLRIERGSAALADLMDALLALARASTPERIHTEPTDPSPLVAQALAAQSRLLAEAGLVGRVDARDESTLALPRNLFEIALRNLLRVLAEEHVPGALLAEIRGARLRLAMEGVPVAQTIDAAQLAPDRSVALGLVARLTQRLGWPLAIGLSERGEIVELRVDLAPA